MEQRLVEAEWSGGTGPSVAASESEEKEREQAINKLASQVEQQVNHLLLLIKARGVLLKMIFKKAPLSKENWFKMA